MNAPLFNNPVASIAGGAAIANILKLPAAKNETQNINQGNGRHDTIFVALPFHSQQPFCRAILKRADCRRAVYANLGIVAELSNTGVVS